MVCRSSLEEKMKKHEPGASKIYVAEQYLIKALKSTRREG